MAQHTSPRSSVLITRAYTLEDLDRAPWLRELVGRVLFVLLTIQLLMLALIELG